MSSRPARSAVMLTLLPLLLAGCGGAAGSADTDAVAPSPRASVQTAAAPPTVGATRQLDSANAEPLPLDPYLLNAEQQSAVEKAQQKLIVRCMASFGLSYAPPSGSGSRRDSDAPTTRVDSRYGHQNAALMAKWGYHPEGGVPAGAGAKPSAPSMSPEMELVLRGTADAAARAGSGGRTVNGRSVPERGCVGEAVKELTGSADGGIGDTQFADDAKFTTLEQSRNDPRTQAVFRQWSQCMKDAGFDYADPLAALGDPQWRKSPTPTPQELKVATADAGCRHAHNVVGVWYAVDAGYQQQVIAANAAAMAEAKAAVETQVRAAARVTAG
ncbi:hypothetical protein [Kitasatospora sp. NPDC085879]|uniref:hypothetical protein n=1 Tax=Kitasatospora sp. NPDC085879 TaxID=3154769 RepID=UPI0034355E35